MDVNGKKNELLGWRNWIGTQHEYMDTKDIYLSYLFKLFILVTIFVNVLLERQPGL